MISIGGISGSGGSGGGIRGNATTTLTNATISGNTVGAGAPVPSGGTGTTPIAGIAGNAGTAPGIQNGKLAASIAASNAGIAGCTGVTDLGGNLSFPNASCPGTVANPLLGPLVDNGGPTRTRALGAGSGAIDLAAPALCAATDQRGIARPQGAACDSGAYEVAPPAVTTGATANRQTTKATLKGSIVPNARPTTFHFEFGSTTAYGSSTPEASAGAGFGPVDVEAAIAGLKPGKTVHYRLVATNGDGTAAGADATFKTPKFKVKIVGRKATLSEDGKVPITLRCPSNVFVRCAGKLVLSAKGGKGGKGGRRSLKKGRKTKLGVARFKIRAGAKAKVRVKLSAKGRDLVEAAGGKGLAVTATAKAFDGAHNRGTTTARLKIKG